jgi:hypothetical protein
MNELYVLLSRPVTLMQDFLNIILATNMIMMWNASNCSKSKTFSPSSEEQPVINSFVQQPQKPQILAKNQKIEDAYYYLVQTFTSNARDAYR